MPESELRPLDELLSRYPHIQIQKLPTHNGSQYVVLLGSGNKLSMSEHLNEAIKGALALDKDSIKGEPWSKKTQRGT